MKLAAAGQVRDVRVEEGAAWLDGRRIALEVQPDEGGGMTLRVDGRRFRAAAARDGSGVRVFCSGRTFAFERAGARASRPAEHAGGLVAPMPGRVRQALVRPGDRVARGQVVLVLEAMKMEHAIRAPRDGVVRRLSHEEGELVEAGAELAVIEG